MSILIGIAGGSGSGKTTLARALARALEPSALIIAEDDYYRCATTIPGFEASRHDFDALDAKDMARLAADLAALKRGETVEKPLYDYVTHTRRPVGETVAPAPFMIAEGILALADPDVRAAYDLAVWIDTPGDVRLLRRIRRDIIERGRTLDSVLVQYERTVRPSHMRHEKPQAQTADLVLDAEALAHDLDAMVARVLLALSRLPERS
jgi:uridine kinase